jgi:hypothetical protein
LFQKAEGEPGKPGEFSCEERVSCSGLVLTAASEDVCWDFGDKRTNGDETLTSGVPQRPELLQESEVLQERIYCNLVELAEDPVYENQRYRIFNM